MSLLQEAAFTHLLPEYECAFGEPPPQSITDVDDLVDHMREHLRTAPRRELSFLDGNRQPSNQTAWALTPSRSDPACFRGTVPRRNICVL